MTQEVIRANAPLELSDETGGAWPGEAQMQRPPSTSMQTPVTMLASSEQR